MEDVQEGKQVLLTIFKKNVKVKSFKVQAQQIHDLPKINYVEIIMSVVNVLFFVVNILLQRNYFVGHKSTNEILLMKIFDLFSTGEFIFNKRTHLLFSTRIFFLSMKLLSQVVWSLERYNESKYRHVN